MTDAERKRAFEKACATELKARAALLTQTREDVIKLLNEALAEIKALLADAPTEYEMYKLPLLQKQIEQTLTVFSNNSAEVLSQGATQAWAGGQALVVAPLEAAGILAVSGQAAAAQAALGAVAVGIKVAAKLPMLDNSMLMAMSNFMTDRIKDVGREAAAKINAELGLVLIGAQTPAEAASKIDTILGGESRARALTITHTELARVYAVSSQQRLEKEAERVPGLQKQWRRSGKIHSRLNHDLMDGVVIDVGEKFNVVSKDGVVVEMLHPHDPKAPACEVINCGCACRPWKTDWKMRYPGKKPFSERELQHDPKGIKRAINDAIQNPVKLAEANFNRAQARDAKGQWAKGGGIHAVLTGNELGAHGSTKALRKAAMAHAARWVGHTFTNANSGHTIKVTRQGLKHSLAGTNDPEIRLTAALPDMLKKAHYVGAKAPTEKHLRRGVVAMHQYLAKVSMGGEHFKVGIVTHEKGDGHEHYNHAIVAKV